MISSRHSWLSTSASSTSDIEADDRTVETAILDRGLYSGSLLGRLAGTCKCE